MAAGLIAASGVKRHACMALKEEGACCRANWIVDKRTAVVHILYNGMISPPFPRYRNFSRSHPRAWLMLADVVLPRSQGVRLDKPHHTNEKDAYPVRVYVNRVLRNSTATLTQWFLAAVPACERQASSLPVECGPARASVVRNLFVHDGGHAIQGFVRLAHPMASNCAHIPSFSLCSIGFVIVARATPSC